MSNLTATQIIAALHTLSIDDIFKVNAASCTIAKAKKRSKAYTAKQSLYEGMHVKWTGRKGPQKGTILKVNRVTCIVALQYQPGVKYKVPMTMLTQA